MSGNNNVYEFEFGTLREVPMSGHVSSFDDLPDVEVRTVSADTGEIKSFFYQVNLNKGVLHRYNTEKVVELLYSRIVRDIEDETHYRYEWNLKQSYHPSNNVNHLEVALTNIVKDAKYPLMKYSRLSSSVQSDPASVSIVLTNFPRQIQVKITGKEKLASDANSQSRPTGTVCFNRTEYVFVVRSPAGDIRDYASDDVIIYHVSEAFNEAFPFVPLLTDFKIDRD